MPVNFHNVTFIKSAAEPTALIDSPLPSIVFSGKSNVGKSSVINRVLNRANFARVGAKPGKTVHINYFDVDGKLLLCDLPGYGYAAVAKTERDRWAKLCEDFFATRRFALGILIVDARHKPTADDVTMSAWYRDTGSKAVVVANKVDKVKKSQLEGNLALIRETLMLPDAEILPFSAETGQGRTELTAIIERAAKTGV